MKKLFLALFMLAARFALADATFTTHLMNISGAATPNRNFVRLEIKGCAGFWPTVPTVGQVELTQDFTPDGSGNISTTIKANDQIQCNGIYSGPTGLPITYYKVTYYSAGVPQSSGNFYVFNNTTFDPHSSPTIAGVPPSGNLVDANVRDFTAFQTVTSPDGVFTDQVISPLFIGQFHFRTAPTACPGGEAASGINVDFTLNCTPIVGGGPGVAPGAQFKLPAYLGAGTQGIVSPVNSTTDATGNQLNSPIANGAYQAFSNQTSGGNNGIANASAALLAAGIGTVAAGPNYANTSPLVSISYASGGSGWAVNDTFSVSGGAGGVGRVTAVSGGVPTAVTMTTPGTGYSTTSNALATAISPATGVTFFVNTSGSAEITPGSPGQPALNVLIGNSAEIDDLRGGMSLRMHSNPGPTGFLSGKNWVGAGDICNNTTLPGQEGGSGSNTFGGPLCYVLASTTFNPGKYYGFTDTPISLGSPTDTLALLNQTSYSAAIHNSLSVNGTFHAQGDIQVFQVIGAAAPVWNRPADEGFHIGRFQSFELPEMTATVLTGGSQATTISFTVFDNGGNFGAGNIAADVTTGVRSGTTSASALQGSGLSLATWTGTTLPVSKSATVTNDILTPLTPPAGPNQQCSNQSFAITTSTAFNVGDLIGFADIHYSEVARVIAPQGTISSGQETIVACLLYPHYATTPIYANGMVGTYIDFPDFTYNDQSYLQQIFASPSSSTILFGFQSPGGLTSFGINAAAAIFQGCEITAVTPPTQANFQPTTFSCMPNNAAWTAGGSPDTFVVANNISQTWGHFTEFLSVQNPFAHIIAHDDIVDGRGWTNVASTPLFQRLVNSNAFANYVAGSIAPTVREITGVWSNYLVMNTPQSIGPGFGGCAATVICVNGPPSGASPTGFNFLAYPSIGGVVNFDPSTNDLGLGGWHQLNTSSINIADTSGHALLVSGDGQLIGGSRYLKICYTLDTDCATLGLASPADVGPGILGVGCTHAFPIDATTCVGPFAAGNINVNGALAFISAGSDTWEQLALGTGSAAQVTDLVFVDVTQPYAPFGMHSGSASSGAVYLPATGVFQWLSANINQSGSVADTGISRCGPACFDFGNGTPGDASGTIHCASGCGGGGGGGGVSSPLTTKGDLWGFNTGDGRIPVGTNGNVLTADSTSVLGVSWQTPSGTGTVTTSGTPTTGFISLFTGSTVIGNSHVDDGITTAGVITSTEPIVIASTSDPSGDFYVPSGASLATVAGAAGIGSPATVTTPSFVALFGAPCSGLWKLSNASGIMSSTCQTVIAPIQVTVANSTSVAAGCNSSSTSTMTGVSASTSTFQFTPASDGHTITGWSPGGGLYIYSWPTSNTVNWMVCNSSGSTVVTSADLTFNVSATP